MGDIQAKLDESLARGWADSTGYFYHDLPLNKDSPPLIRPPGVFLEFWNAIEHTDSGTIYKGRVTWRRGTSPV